MRKIYTKDLTWAENFAAATCGWGGVIKTIQWQEDVTVIGVELSVWTRDEALIGNDGFAMSSLVLLPVPGQYTDGVVGYATAVQDWNTGFSSSHPPANVVIMFPAGFGMTMKEGETLSAQSIFANTTSAPVGFVHHAVIYYVKGTK